MTTIVRYDGGQGARVGLLDGGGVHPLPVESVASLLRLRLDELRALVEGPRDEVVDVSGVRLLAPVDERTEVWASGVTYERSRDARVEESSVQDVYQRVYEAERPELFFKAVAWRVVPDGQPVAVRVDSAQNVPEPELVLVVNRHAEVVGYCVGNDMSSRSIEGANPLYLPQAKVYDGSFSLSSGIRPAWELPEVAALGIGMDVVRDGAVAWSGATGTDRLARTFADLVEHLYRCCSFPDGALLSTGTGIVPELDFTVLPGDEVRIRIDGVGTLCNPVMATGTPSLSSL